MHLQQLGWDSFVEKSWDVARTEDPRLLNPFCQPGRVVRQAAHTWFVMGASGTFLCEPTGRFSHNLGPSGRLPAVGDWVIFRPWSPEDDHGYIEALLPAKSTLRRIVAGDRSDQQVIASNIDHVFIVTSANEELNLNRLERYLFLCQESRVACSIVISKSDLHSETVGLSETLKKRWPEVPILLTSSVNRAGLDGILGQLPLGQTGTFVGSSGVGKSTLLNSLTDSKRMATQDISFAAKGRHTTTHRELCFLGEGHGMIIDTPGMREIQLPVSDDAVDSLFSDIVTRAAQCKFGNCQHQQEPGCAIQEALVQGEIPKDQWRSYQKFLAEQAYQKRRESKADASEERKKWKKVAKDLRANPKYR